SISSPPSSRHHPVERSPLSSSVQLTLTPPAMNEENSALKVPRRQQSVLATVVSAAPLSRRLPPHCAAPSQAPIARIMFGVSAGSRLGSALVMKNSATLGTTPPISAATMSAVPVLAWVENVARPIGELAAATVPPRPNVGAA